MKAISYDLSRWKRYFFPIWSGQMGSLFGSRLVDFALVWYMTTATGSAVVLTTASTVAMLPMILAPFIGSLVDRWKRRSMMIFADGLIAVFTLLIGLLFWLGNIHIWHLYVLLFVRSTGSVIHFMSMMASTSLMVPEQHLSRVAGMNQTFGGVMNIAGPTAGALAMTVLPIYWILFIDVITALIAIIPLVFIRIPELSMHAQQKLEKLTLVRDIREGFRYIWSSKGLFGLMMLSLILNFLAAPIYTILPLLVTDHFGGGALQLGWLEGAAGVGVVVGGLLLSAWGGFKKRVISILAGAILLGWGMIFLGTFPTREIWLGVSACFVMGFSIAFTDGPFGAILQARVAPEIQGRIFSVVLSLIKMSTPAALLLSGQLVELFGVRFWYLAAGILLVLVNMASFRISAIMRLEDQPLTVSLSESHQVW